MAPTLLDCFFLGCGFLSGDFDDGYDSAMISDLLTVSSQPNLDFNMAPDHESHSYDLCHRGI